MITDEQNMLITRLVKNNDSLYNMHKAGEECQELGLVLTQYILKPESVDIQEVIDEIGDVVIRLEYLKRIFPMAKIQERIDHKLDKYKDLLEMGKYKNI